MLRFILMGAVLAGTAMASDAALVIPEAGGPLVIDGVPNEAIWQKAAVLPLGKSSLGAPFPQGGEMRVAARNGYLCFSARVPEKGRPVAHSMGENPAWWQEDQVIWTVRFKGFAVALRVTVNPLGAFSAEYIRAREERGYRVLASASAAADGWTAEAAIPVESIGAIGFISAERVRAARPDAPELRWFWPGSNQALTYALKASGAEREAPPLRRKEWGKAAAAAAPESADALEADLRRVPHRVWPEAEGKADGMWDANLRERVTAAAAAERREWERVHSVADWERFRDQRITALKRSLGRFPARTPLRAEVTRRVDIGEGFVIENVIFESRPGLVVTANLYLPSKIAGRIPAVVIVHSHHAPKTEKELQDMGMTWARSGTAVLVMDLPGAGERVQSQPWPREGYYSRYALGMQLYLAGESLMKWMAWDLMRGIDLLLARPYVDPQRVVMLGAVAGGGDPAAVTGVLDPRIAAVLPFNFGEAGPEEHYTEGPRPYDPETADPGWGGWESTRSLRLSMAGQFFPWLICAARAPRPFVFSFEIGWPNGIEKEPVWARYKKVYGLYGQPGRLAQVDGYGPFPGPGEVTNVGADLRAKIYPILKRWLDMPAPGTEYRNLRADAELMCLTAQAAAQRRPKTVSELAEKMAAGRLAAAREKRAGLNAADRLRALRTALKEKLGDIEPEAAAPARVLWNRTFPQFTAEGVLVESGRGMRVPLLLIKPTGGSSTPLPVVLAVGQGGKAAFLTRRGSAIAALLRQGTAVCLADVRGTGETAREGARTSVSQAATELMLGNTAMGGRVKDTRTVVRYLAGRGDMDARRIVLWGDGFAQANPREMLFDQSPHQQGGAQNIEQADAAGGMLALLTALYEGGIKAVAARGGLVSYGSVLRDRFCYAALDVMVPGVLETADMADVAAALTPRALLLAGLVDGRNRPAAQAELNAEYKTVREAYGEAATGLAIREGVADTEVARWIAEQAGR